MSTTWTIAIDWDRNGDFDGTYDDVTSRVIDVNWFSGRRKPYEDTADDSMIELTLRNDDKRFSPENASGPLNGKLVPYRPIIVKSNNGTERTMFKGWVENIQPSVNKNGDRTVKIVAAGPMQFMKSADTKITLQENQRTDEIIAVLLQEVVIPPALSGAWFLGLPGSSELGVGTFLADTTAYQDLDQGITTLAFAGDNWVQNGGAAGERETFNVYRAVQDVVAAERGRFFFDREGKAIFWNRHHLLMPLDPSATFDDTMQNMAYVYGAPDELKNDITVVCHPRTISGTANEILWQLETDVRIPEGGSRTVVARYRDNSGNRAGGRSVTVGNVVFKEGAGTVTITPRANSAELLITNTGSGYATLSSCTVNGEKISDFGRMEAQAEDSISIAHYGRRTMRLSLPALDNFEDAQNIALFELDRRKDPRGSVRQIELRSHGQNGGGHHANQLGLTIGDKITVMETQTAHDNQYYIIGEAHRLSEGGSILETTWYLESATNAEYWILGETDYSELGVGTILAY